MSKKKVWIYKNPAILGGKPIIKGTRIPVWTIEELHKAGYGIDHVEERYPQLRALGNDE